MHTVRSRNRWAKYDIAGLILALLIFWAAPASVRAEPAVPSDALPIVLNVSTSLERTTEGSGRIEADPDKSAYDYGENVTLTAVPDVGWSFLRWESEVLPALPWWNSLWDYRVLVRIDANGVTRRDQPVVLDINFTELMGETGQSGLFEAASIRVVEVGVDGQVLDENIPYQFEEQSGYNPGSYAAGSIIIGLPGVTGAAESRLFHIYFGTIGTSYPPASFDAWVQLTSEGVTDEGLDAYQIETLAGTYFYQKVAGGISSLVDAAGFDWVQYSTAPGGRGVYRGIPNAVPPQDGGHLHPGMTTAQSRIVATGPLRTIILSEVTDPQTQQLLWTVEWRFYPDHVEATVLDNVANFWFLYEGVPGGSIGIEDKLTLSDGTTLGLADSWSGNLNGPDWAFFSDESLSRSLFLYNRSSEEVGHSYRPYPENATDNVEMTVFGFGRPLTQLAPEFTVSPAYFTFGLVDDTSYSRVDEAIQAVSTGFSALVDTTEYRLRRIEMLPADNPLILTMDLNRTVTAQFAENVFELELTTAGDGAGVIIADPAQVSYADGAPVKLSAIPDPGSSFTGWSGAVTGAENPTRLTMQKDTSIIASFTRNLYQVIVRADGGTVAIEPRQAGYYYGDSVVLIPVAADGYTFVEWLGDAEGNQVPLEISVTQDLEIDAIFKPLYELTTLVDSNEQGAVLVEPEKADYVSGENVRLSALPNAGWVFVGWDGDVVSQENPIIVTMDSDKSIRARFVRAVTLQLDVRGSGTVDATPPTYPDGYILDESVSLTARPAAGWTFVKWSGDAAGEENPLVVTLTRDSAIVALFEPDQRVAFLPFIAR